MDLNNINSFISSLDTQATAWYSGLSGHPIVTTPQSAALNQLQLQQQAQANLAVSNPTLTGLLANPTLIVLAVLVLIVLGIYVFKS